MPTETTPRKSLRSPISPAFDALIEKAFAPKSTPMSTPRMTAAEARMSLASVSTMIPDAPAAIPEPEYKLLEIWEKVIEAKSKQMEALPSKVKSLEGTKPQRQMEGVGLNRTLTRRKSMVTFKEAPDSETITATFEMAGVKKQDMHVSYRCNRIVVTWRRTRVVEKMEGSLKVREKQEKQYNQIIPIPEGTKFEDIRATRDARKLTLTYPSFKGTAKESPTRIQIEEQEGSDTEEPASPRTAVSEETEFHTCIPE